MPDYTIGVAERIASLPDSTATSNSVNRNYFQETSQSVVNIVNVAIAPAAPTALDPTPTTTYATATDETSVDTFGTQETPIVITLLATIEDAGALAEYLIRGVPAYWFSNLAISLNTLSDANKNIVANLEIGQQIAVTKTFPAGVVPQTVTEYLFVEGISHSITVESHVVTIYTGPATTYLQWVLGNYTTTSTRTNILTNPNFEVSVDGWNTSNTSVARVTTDSYLGVASMSIGITVAAVDARVGQTQNWDAVAGVTYTGSVYLKNTAGNNRQMNVSLRYVNSGGVTISEIFGTAQSTTVGGAWTRFTVTGLAPALTTNADLLIYPNTTNASLTNVTLADAALVEVSGSALPYFDGTYDDAYTGYTLTFQAWNGTANTSTSTTVWGLNTSGTGSALGDTTYGLA
jgi:hypothetical protein